MRFSDKKKYLRIDSPATYCIRISGRLGADWSERLGGLRITSCQRRDKTIVSTLYGPLRDQGELLGILNSLYELHLPILSVEYFNNGVKAN